MSHDDRQFRRVIEDFSCFNCGFVVSGDGYTNHCPECLHSCHVDVNPGDRAANCGGLMAPVKIRQDGKKELMLLHRCESCGHEKWNRTSPDDDVDQLGYLMH